MDSVPAAGFYQLNLLPHLAASLQPDMRDIRIVDATGKQIPYILKADPPIFKENKFTALPVIAVKKEADRQTHIVIENTLHRSLNQLLLIIKNTDAGRSVTLSGSDDNNNWFVIKEHIYLNNFVSSKTDRFIRSLDFPLSSYRYLKIIINGKDLLPLNIVQAGVYEQTQLTGKYLPLPPPLLLQKDSTDKSTYVSARFGHAYFTDRVIITVNGPKFYNRQAEIYDNAAGTHVLLARFNISSDRETMVPLAAKTNRLLLKINNDDNPPLRVSAISAFQLNRYLITYLEKNAAYQLLFDDSTATAPVYDLEVFKDSIAGNAIPLLYGAIEKNKPAPKKLPANTTGNKVIIWMAIGFAVTILLLLSYKLLGDIKNKP